MNINLMNINLMNISLKNISNSAVITVNAPVMSPVLCPNFPASVSAARLNLLLP